MSNIFLSLILGLGSCNDRGEWCERPTGKLAIEQGITQKGPHGLFFTAEHFSRIGDGELKGKGDRGMELYFIEYRLDLNEIFD